MKRLIYISLFFLAAATSGQAIASTPIYLGPPIKVGEMTITSLAKTLNSSIGSYFSAHFQVSGGVAPFTWKTDGLPPGLNLSLLPSAITACEQLDSSSVSSIGQCPPLYISGDAIVISGVPTTNGTYPTTFSVHDSNGKEAVGIFTFTVGTSNTGDLQIVSLSELSGIAKKSFSASFQVHGGTGPYNWSIANGSLPPGTNLSFARFNCIVAPCIDPKDTAYIAGTPSQAGSYSFTLQAIDNRGIVINQSFTILISADSSKDYGITVTSPKPGETWELGTTHTIMWSNYTNRSQAISVMITLAPPRPACLDANPRCLIAEMDPYVISASTADTGSFSWTIPPGLPSAYTGTRHITIVSTVGALQGTSGSFTLQSGDTVPQPNKLSPASVVRTPGKAVHLVLDGNRYYTFRTWNEFIQKGYRFQHIQQIRTDFLTGLTQITTFERPSGTTLRYAGERTVYYLTAEKCKQAYTNLFILRAWKVKELDIVLMPKEEQFPTCAQAIVRLPAGVAVKVSGPTVYTYANGTLRPVASFDAFKRLGSPEIFSIGQSDFAMYPQGELVQ